MGLYEVAEIRRSGCGPHLVSHLVDDLLPHWKPMERRPEQRPSVGAIPALADDSGQVVPGAL